MIRTRIAPSPTGEDLHIGNLYTALMNWAYARKHKGRFIVRIEDTDRERLVIGSETRILQTLKNYGLDVDEGIEIGGEYAPYRQSERLKIYHEFAQELVDEGHAYYCFCTKERLENLRKEQQLKKQKTHYDKHCKGIKDYDLRIKNGEPHIIRLDVPQNRQITFKDLIRGEITINSNEIDDQVLIKSDGFPTYHLAVVIDDHLMKISHIIRAEEWISSTPKHIILYNAFGWELPVFAHLPILRNPDRSKLSKRKNPVWSSEYLKNGFLPEAVLNYLALMGWSHPEGKEIFSIKDFIESFDLKDINAVGPIFDIVKLRWMNGTYIRSFDLSSLISHLSFYLKQYYPQLKIDEKLLLQLIPLVQSRMETLKDFVGLTEHFSKEPEIKLDDTEKEIGKKLILEFAQIKVWNKDNIFATLKKMMQEKKLKMNIFYKIFTGQEKGLPLPESLEILGQEKSLKRLSFRT